ncbi:hypothetical protein JCM11491_002812 [Sporobolomyces phaffii]
MDALSKLTDDDWVECKSVFETALGQLSLGQLVQDPRYTMMDLMSAIEINDARTDSYVAARTPARDALPDFDPARELDVDEAVTIIDELMRLEATFQDGQPLMSTLWNCNYFRVPSLETLASTIPAGPVNSVQAVFRAMLLGILKSQEIVWEECCKGHVYEHEDVHLASSTLSFDSLMSACYPPRAEPSPSPPRMQDPLLVAGQSTEAAPPKDRAISIDDVLRLLDESSHWLQTRGVAHTDDERDAVERLLLRVTLRIDLLYASALLTFPAHTSPSQIQNHLTRISTYSSDLPAPSSPTSPAQPRPLLESIFAPSPSIPLLATSAPPRLIEPFPLGESYDRCVRLLVRELEGLCQLWQGWRNQGAEGFGWKDVKEYSRMLARREVSPYVRSLHQTVLTSTPSHIFSISPLIHFATSFLSTLTSIPSAFFLEDLFTLRQTETDYSSPAHVVFAWLERLAQELVRTSVPLAGQNRTRQFRWVRKSVPTWARLVDETERDIVPILAAFVGPPAIDGQGRARRGIESLGLAIRATFLELVVESVACGFEREMELYRTDESSRVWFVLSRIAEELEGAWNDLSQELSLGQDKYVKAKLGEARAIKEMSRGSLVTSILFPSAEPKFSSPFLASVAIDPGKADRGRHGQRFDWLSAGGLVRAQTGFDAYTSELRSLQAASGPSLAQAGKVAYEHAIAALTLTASVPLADRGCSVRPEFTLRNLASLRRTAFTNQNKLTSILNESPSQKRSTSNLVWDHAWFPIHS